MSAGTYRRTMQASSPWTAAAFAVTALALLAPAADAASTRAKVIRVVDADSVRVSVAGKTRTVDLLGVDAPVGRDCFAAEASTALRRTAPPRRGGAPQHRRAAARGLRPARRPARQRHADRGRLRDGRPRRPPARRRPSERGRGPRPGRRARPLERVRRAACAAGQSARCRRAGRTPRGTGGTGSGCRDAEAHQRAGRGHPAPLESTTGCARRSCIFNRGGARVLHRRQLLRTTSSPSSRWCSPIRSTPWCGVTRAPGESATPASSPEER